MLEWLVTEEKVNDAIFFLLFMFDGNPKTQVELLEHTCLRKAARRFVFDTEEGKDAIASYILIDYEWVVNSIKNKNEVLNRRREEDELLTAKIK